jgi:rhodanese-related sulfurtransferase
MNTYNKTKSFQNLSSQEFQLKLTTNPEAVVLDVRTPSEFLSGTLPNAININVMDSSFSQKLSRLDKTKSYFVYCRSGGRSAQACSLMASQGFEVHNLAGGIANWTGEIC